MNNYKRLVLLIICVGLSMTVNAEGIFISKGSNIDPESTGLGHMPYEMHGRPEPRTPLLTFEDCSTWSVESKGAVAYLNRSTDQRMFEHASGELTYLATDADSVVTVRAEMPIVIPEPWDNLSLWVYGNSWQYGDVVGPLDLEIILVDARGKESFHHVPSYYKGTINYKFWWYLRVKIHQEPARPVKLAGFRFSGKKITFPGKSETIYLGPVYAYQQELKPLSFEEFPKDLPFPVKGQTPLPVNKEASYENHVGLEGDVCVFRYEGKDTTLTYRVNPEKPGLDAITVEWKDKPIQPCAQGGARTAVEAEQPGRIRWIPQSSRLDDKVFTVVWMADDGAVQKTIDYRYSIRQKSLVVEIEEEASSDGIFAEVHLGRAENVRDPKLFRVPMLNFDYAEAPRLLYADGLFFFTQFDWYYSQASLFYAKEFPVDENSAVFNGGARYNPKTNGTRNPVRERLYINVSPDVQEVLPTIPNPKSPMPSLMGTKAWLTINCVGMSHEDRLRIPRKYRNLGMEHVAVRYHEGTWRDGGESFTFRADASPVQGGNDALRDMVSRVKSLGWLCGLYTNYTDFSPVNPGWNEDWLRLESNGDWIASWFASYSVKPMIAWQEQMKYAPVIHKRYGTNHCYCDVHTAVPPFARVDYDSRVPGAATFRRTFEAYGLILLRERQAHKGPVYSEGGNHWWYAGLVDGNYANAFPSLAEQPLFVDFDLLKIHPLQMDAGNVNYVFDADTTKAGGHIPLSFAYGHICQLTPYNEAESMKRYYLIQPLQPYFAMVPVREIRYWNGSRFVDTSEALRTGANLEGKVFLEYESGLRVWVNIGDADWRIEVNGRPYLLPKTGFFAHVPDSRVQSFSIAGEPDARGGRIQVDFSKGPDSYYLDTRGGIMTFNEMAGRGAAALKKEKSGWYLIPARTFKEIGFNPKIIDENAPEITVEALDEQGLPLGPADTKVQEGKIWVVPKSANEFKYRITPSAVIHLPSSDNSVSCL